MEPEFEQPIRMFSDSKDNLSIEEHEGDKKSEAEFDATINVVTSKSFPKHYNFVRTPTCAYLLNPLLLYIFLSGKAVSGIMQLVNYRNQSWNAQSRRPHPKSSWKKQGKSACGRWQRTDCPTIGSWLPSRSKAMKYHKDIKEKLGVILKLKKEIKVSHITSYNKEVWLQVFKSQFWT